MVQVWFLGFGVWVLEVLVLDGLEAIEALGVPPLGSSSGSRDFTPTG